MEAALHDMPLFRGFAGMSWRRAAPGESIILLTSDYHNGITSSPHNCCSVDTLRSLKSTLAAMECRQYSREFSASVVIIDRTALAYPSEGDA